MGNRTKKKWLRVKLVLKYEIVSTNIQMHIHMTTRNKRK